MTDHDEDQIAHIVPVHQLVLVWASLVVLTIVTVAVPGVDMGAANIWVALGIATLKASLVALFFMHLWWDSKFNTLVLLGAIVFLAVFLGLVLIDSKEYQPSIEWKQVQEAPR